MYDVRRNANGVPGALIRLAGGNVDRWPRRIVSLLAVALLVACARPVVAFPDSVDITPPAPGLAPELAAYSGIWEGLWTDQGTFTFPGTGLPSRLAVEEITADHATLVYGWAANPGHFDAGWQRLSATMQPGGKLVFGASATFTLVMAGDRNSIAGVRSGGGVVSTITFTRAR